MVGDTIIVEHPSDRIDQIDQDDQEDDIPVVRSRENSVADLRDNSKEPTLEHNNEANTSGEPDREGDTQPTRRSRIDYGPPTRSLQRIQNALVAVQETASYVEPLTIRQALTGADKEHWFKAIVSKTRSL